MRLFITAAFKYILKEENMKISSKVLAVVFVAAACFMTGNSFGEEQIKRGKVQFASSDGIVDVINKYTGKRITIRLTSGTELSGTVNKVPARLIYLTEISVGGSNKDYFDSVINPGEIAAVDIRMREDE